MIVRLPGCWRDLVTLEFSGSSNNRYVRHPNGATFVNEGPAPTVDDPRPFTNDLREVTVVDGKRMVTTFRLTSDQLGYHAEVVVINEQPQIYHAQLESFGEIEEHAGEEFVIAWVDAIEQAERIQHAS